MKAKNIHLTLLESVEIYRKDPSKINLLTILALLNIERRGSKGWGLPKALGEFSASIAASDDGADGTIEFLKSIVYSCHPNHHAALSLIAVWQSELWRSRDVVISYDDLLPSAMLLLTHLLYPYASHP